MPKIRFIGIWRGWQIGQEYDCEDWFAAERLADGTAVLSDGTTTAEQSAIASPEPELPIVDDVVATPRRRRSRS